MHFCYVFFLAIGYGDYVPVTPAGRGMLGLYRYTVHLTSDISLLSSVIFTMYALLAV